MAEPVSSKVWVAAWLQKAEHEIETAERALNAGAPITNTAAYHCHQAAEKALKAFLASRFGRVGIYRWIPQHSAEGGKFGDAVSGSRMRTSCQPAGGLAAVRALPARKLVEGFFHL